MTDDAGAQNAPRIPTVDDFPETGVNALATLSQRAWARTIDMGIVIFAIGSLISVFPLDEDDDVRTIILAIAALWFVIELAYETTMVSIFGATAGKLALGTRVARFADGATPRWDQVMLRCLLPLSVGIAVLVLFEVPFLGAAAVYVTAAFDELARGWHDKAGGTVVIRTR